MKLVAAQVRDKHASYVFLPSSYHRKFAFERLPLRIYPRRQTKYSQSLYSPNRDLCFYSVSNISVTINYCTTWLLVDNIRDFLFFSVKLLQSQSVNKTRLFERITILLTRSFVEYLCPSLSILASTVFDLMLPLSLITSTGYGIQVFLHAASDQTLREAEAECMKGITLYWN